jgi:hypothetical protein
LLNGIIITDQKICSRRRAIFHRDALKKGILKVP